MCILRQIDKLWLIFFQCLLLLLDNYGPVEIQKKFPLSSHSLKNDVKGHCVSHTHIHKSLEVLPKMIGTVELLIVQYILVVKITRIPLCVYININTEYIQNKGDDDAMIANM